MAVNTLGSPQNVEMQSPNGQIKILFSVSTIDGLSGVPNYRVTYKNRNLINKSPLGLRLKSGGGPSGARFELESGFEILRVSQTESFSSYSLPVGKTRQVHDRYRQYTIFLKNTSRATTYLNFIFRLYNDGASFRYLVPKQNQITNFSLVKELTEFRFAGDPTIYGLPLGFGSAYESHYTIGPLAEFDTAKPIGMPLAVDFSGATMEVSEADIHGYTQTYFLPTPQGLKLALPPPSTESSEGSYEESPKESSKETGAPIQNTLPFKTPWRVMIIGDSPALGLQSNVITDLAEPSKIKDTSWIKPGKILFQWWNGYVVPGSFYEKPSDVLNEKTLKSYVDFCAKNKITYVSLDGFEFDKAWYGGGVGSFDPTTQDVTKSAPEVNAQEVIRYARQKGVGVRVWMHTNGLTEKNMESVFSTYNSWGVQSIMVDFMGDDKQSGVAHVEKILSIAAKYHLMVALHGMAKPTGFQRTYPNFLTQEGVMNQEYNKWGADDPDSPHSDPDHEVTAAIIRGAVGPMDTHQGSMRPVPEKNFVAHSIAPNSIGTLAHQIANYVVYENPNSMLADYPQAYLQHPEAFRFILGVPNRWDETLALKADLNKKVVTVARRNGKDWYVGTMNGRIRNRFDLPLNFLEPGKTYLAEIYSDTASSEENGEEMSVVSRPLTSKDILSVNLAAGGGQAVKFHQVDQ